MAIHSKASTNWALPLKVLTLSAAAFSVAVALKASVPAILDFAAVAEASLPHLWAFALSWLRPPYLYIVINCIIITIVASSKLQSKADPGPAAEAATAALRVHYLGYDDGAVPILALKAAPEVDVYGGVGQEKAAPTSFPDFSPSNGGDESPGNPVRYAEFSETDDSDELSVSPEIHRKEVISEINGHDELAVLRSPLSRNDFSLSNSGGGDEITVLKSPEIPLVSTRFGHRKASKFSPEGGRRALRVARAKRPDTLESTWKTITDGRAIPLTRHLKKSDAWDRKEGGGDNNSSEAATAITTPARLRNQASLSQDDLNRRVEAFIKKFNEDMRLQRQESLQHYQEMISRGARH